MVIIKTTCPTCGEVDLTSDKIALRIAVGGNGTSYTFECPACTQQIRKPADSRVVQLLISGGVAPEVISDQQADQAARAEHPVRAARPSLPPITYDDILEFHREIEAGVLDKFLRSAA